MAALISARISSFIMNPIRLSSSMVHLWTDSQIVFNWLHSEKLKQLLSHRVSEILRLTTTIVWRYCPLLTRGITLTQLQLSPTLAFRTSMANYPWQLAGMATINNPPLASSRYLDLWICSSNILPTHHVLHQIMDLANYRHSVRLWESLPLLLRFTSNIKNKSSTQKLGHPQQLSLLKPRWSGSKTASNRHIIMNLLTYFLIHHFLNDYHLSDSFVYWWTGIHLLWWKNPQHSIVQKTDFHTFFLPNTTHINDHLQYPY